MLKATVALVGFSFLDGTVKVIEGRGYEEDGSVGFNWPAAGAVPPE